MALVGWVTSRHGMGVTHDSTVYVATADRLRAGDGVGFWLEPRLTTWPLGYPAVLAAVRLATGLSSLGAARLVALTVAAATPPLAASLARAAGASRSRALAAAAGSALSVGILTLQTKVLSDGLFAAGALAFVLLLLKRTDRAASGAGVVAAALFLLRYAGVVLVPVGLVTISAQATLLGRRVTIHRCIRLAMAPCLAVAAYLGYNRWASGHWLGKNRSGSDQAPSSVTQKYFEGVGSWAFGRSGYGSAYLVAGLAVAASMTVAALYGWRRRAESTGTSLAIATAAAMWGMLALRTKVGFDLDVRTAGFLLPLLVVNAAAHIEQLPGRRAVSAVFVMWVATIAVLGLRDAQLLRERGSGYTSAQWRGVLAAAPEVRALDSDCTLRSNWPHPLYLAGFEAAFAPKKTQSPQLNENDCVLWIDIAGTEEPSLPYAELAANNALVELARGPNYWFVRVK